MFSRFIFTHLHFPDLPKKIQPRAYGGGIRQKLVRKQWDPEVALIHAISPTKNTTDLKTNFTIDTNFMKSFKFYQIFTWLKNKNHTMMKIFFPLLLNHIRTEHIESDVKFYFYEQKLYNNINTFYYDKTT